MNPKWYLESVHIEVPAEEQKLECHVGQWLDKDTGESLVKIDIVPKVTENPGTSCSFSLPCSNKTAICHFLFFLFSRHVNFSLYGNHIKILIFSDKYQEYQIHSGVH